MDVHWVDAAAPELNGKPFTQTFLYGTYRGRLTFFEARSGGAFEIKQPEAFRGIGLAYPTRYTIRFDERTRE